MKVINNENGKYYKKSNDSENLTSFHGNKFINKITNFTHWKIASKAMAALGLTTVSLSQNNKDEDNTKFEQLLGIQKRMLMSGEVVPAYSNAEIKMLLTLYNENPVLVNQLVQMHSVYNSIESARFRATDIKNLVTAYNDNPQLLTKLVNAGTMKDGKLTNYTYSTEDIIKIMELGKIYPQLINRLVEQKRESDNIANPKYEKIFEFEYIVNAYKKIPTVVEDLLQYPELIAREVAELSDSLYPASFYDDLKKDMQQPNLTMIKQHHEIIKLLKTPIKSLTMKQKENLYHIFNSILPDSTKQIYQKYLTDLDIKINQLELAIGIYQNSVSVPIEKQKLFVSNILANNNPNSDNVLKNFNFSQYKKEGLPLKYLRKDFISKIESVISNLPLNEQEKVLQHFGLIRGYDDFDGLLTNKPFEQTTSEEVNNAVSLIEKEIELFTSENEVITGNQHADKVLTGLIQGLPEFAFFVGKQQHNKHAYSVDIHTLKVLQSAMNHPLYSDLSDESKTVLKMAILLHDFGKKGGVQDEGHAVLSSAYASAILKKFPFNADLTKRIQDIILNHHWFEGYNMGYTKAHQIAGLCRYPQDIMIYEIFAKADLENVNKDFHIQNSEDVHTQSEFNEFMKNKMIPIYDAFYKMRSQSNFAFDTKILNNGEKFPKITVELDGSTTELKVLNFNELKKGESLQKYGFAPNVNKENAYFVVHATPLDEFESTFKLTQNNSNHPAWSTSMVKFDEINTTGEYGFIFNAEQPNLSIGYFDNLSLGEKRNIDNFMNILFLEENDDGLKLRYNKYKNSRVFLRDKLLENLSQKGINLTKQEYAQLTEHILSKRFLTQINKDIHIGNNVIKASDLVEALETTRENLFRGKNNNELEFLSSSVSGLFAKASKIEDCPKEFLKFAAKYDLPIILFPPNNPS